MGITFAGAKRAALARGTTAWAIVGCTIVNSTFFKYEQTSFFLPYHPTYQNYGQSRELPQSTHLELDEKRGCQHIMYFPSSLNESNLLIEDTAVPETYCVPSWDC